MTDLRGTMREYLRLAYSQQGVYPDAFWDYNDSEVRLAPEIDIANIEVGAIQASDPVKIPDMKLMVAQECNKRVDGGETLVPSNSVTHTVTQETHGSVTNALTVGSTLSHEVTAGAEGSFLGLVKSKLETKTGISLKLENTRTTSNGWSNSDTKTFTATTPTLTKVPPGNCVRVESDIYETKRKVNVDYWQELQGTIHFKTPRPPHPKLSGQYQPNYWDTYAVLKNVVGESYPRSWYPAGQLPDALPGDVDPDTPAFDYSPFFPNDFNWLKDKFADFPRDRVRFEGPADSHEEHKVFVKQTMELSIPSYEQRTTTWNVDDDGNKLTKASEVRTPLDDVEDGETITVDVDVDVNK
ncbi:hypothetical protein ACIQMR_37100 [Streptomyces sp. NPDC091376]|uniref:hypothetical protein n=1 Tax=Streptomyces sp. NPDC091376 TaxID=3365994 RepID=UPI0037F6675D